jgi:ElaB/YqjD/DUF883 family membrane-anchored ribosome-binding protein
MSEVKTEKGKELSMEKKLEALFFQFMTLHDRWREDRMATLNKDVEITKLVEKFTEQVEGFEEIGTKLRYELVEAFKNVLAEIRDMAVEDVKEEARKMVDAVVKKLDASVGSAKKVLADSQQVVEAQSSLRSLFMWGASIVVGLLMGFAVIKWFMPDPTLPLTDQQLYELKIGRILYLAKPQMTKEELKHIASLATQAAKQKGVNVGLTED